MSIELKLLIPTEWHELLKFEESKTYFSNLKQILDQRESEGLEIFPSKNDIFKIYNSLNPDQINVVVLGQDPYHNQGEAMGYSFSVPEGMKIPPSLRNVFKEINREYNCTDFASGDLTSWVRQGVFLLNSILTVEKNNPGAHKNIGWQHFTDMTIEIISQQQKNIVFMLWGNFARSKKHLIDNSKHLILEAAHPSPLARNAFSGCDHFRIANEYLKQNGKTQINWCLS